MAQLHKRERECLEESYLHESRVPSSGQDYENIWNQPTHIDGGRPIIRSIFSIEILRKMLM
jgi:hypothetical protein